MAINLDKAQELFRQSMERPIPLNTAPTTVVDHVDQINYNKPTPVPVNPSLCHLGKVPFVDWTQWHAEHHDSDKIRFYVRTVMGRCVPFELAPSETVGALKLRVHESEKIPLHLVRLRTREGKELEKDQLTLEQCGFTFEVAKGDPNNVTLRMLCRESVPWR